LEPLATALKEKKEVVALLKRFDNLRNTLAHSRDLLPFEEDLLAGVAGDIRNRVTIYMSSQDISGDFYPRIESVRDSFGNEPTSAALAELGHWAHCATDLTVRPNDVVDFTCRGTDPQGRELEWAVSTNMSIRWGHATGDADSGTVRWLVSADDVQDAKTILVYMRAKGTDYHRRGSFDQGASFTYRVLPPT
jgi:hypothetical protein